MTCQCYKGIIMHVKKAENIFSIPVTNSFLSKIHRKTYQWLFWSTQMIRFRFNFLFTIIDTSRSQCFMYSTFAHADILSEVLHTNIEPMTYSAYSRNCLLYTSDAADDLLCVDLGGRRIIKKK